ncbi:hypothetical protein C0991_008156 [Blastosporella zonata]|nr:hypothetical protein C0991_008156 [Blastosporella zonata]
MPTIPIEMVDYIIGFLHDYKPCLQACSLVSRDWVGLCRFHLFRTLILADDDIVQSELRLNRLRDSLKAASVVSRYITDLEITHAGGTGRSAILAHSDLPSLLTNLTSLLSIKITASSSAICEITQPLILAMQNMPSLRKIHLSSLKLPYPQTVLQLLRSSILLTELTLTELTFEHPIPGNPRTMEQSIHLHKAGIVRLVTDNAFMASSFTHSLSPITISEVQFLEIWLSTAAFPALTQLLSCTVNLRRLDVTLEADPDHSPILILQELSYLVALTFRIRTLPGRENPLPWLHGVLSSLSPDNCLEEISLVVSVDIPPPNMTRLQFAEILSTWKQFDLLFTKANFLALKRVRIDFRMDNVVGDTVVKAIVDYIIEQLSELDARGVLHIDSYDMGFG